MSEEYKIKVNMPMFELGELETFDNNIHSIVEEYSKLMFKEKDQILTQRIIIKQEEEIKRLHSIIKEVREYIEKRKDTQKWRKESLKEKSTNIDIVLEHYRDILEILDKENDNGER